MESHGKGSEAEKEYLCDRKGIFVCLRSFLEEGLGLGMAPGPEFSWKFLPCAKTRSVIKADLDFQHFCLSFLLVLFGFG